MQHIEEDVNAWEIYYYKKKPTVQNLWHEWEGGEWVGFKTIGRVREDEKRGEKPHVMGGGTTTTTNLL